MDYHIVSEGYLKDGTPFLIRYPVMEDADAMCTYINELSDEQTFVMFQGEHLTIAHETEYLKHELSRIENHESVLLLAFSEGKLIGNSAVDLSVRAARHEGVFTISIASSCRGQGVGRKLMQAVLDESKRQLPALRVMTLGVFADNDVARSLYLSMGFHKYGCLPGGNLHRDKYVDRILMYKSFI